MKKLPYFGFYGFIGLLVLFELLFGNLYLLQHAADQAKNLGISESGVLFRTIILSVLDLIAAFGAFEACVAVYNNNASQLKQAGITAFAGFGLYGIYQFLSAWIYLPESYKISYTAFGILYFFLGLFSFMVSRKYVKDWLSDEKNASKNVSKKK